MPGDGRSISELRLGEGRGSIGARVHGLALIGSAYGATDIAFVRASFDAAEIPVFVLGADVHAVLSRAAVAMGGARIMVFRRDVAAALSVLDTCAFEPAPR